MRTRNAGYEDYGITEAEKSRLLSFCRGAKAEDKELISQALQELGEYDAPYVYMSLVEGKSYEELDAKYWLSMSKGDFYGCRRKGVYLIKERLVKEDAEMNRTFQDMGVMRRFCKVEEACAEVQLAQSCLMRVAREANAIVKVGKIVRIDMNALYSYIDQECKGGMTEEVLPV